jgi:hypothetical protein
LRRAVPGGPECGEGAAFRADATASSASLTRSSVTDRDWSVASRAGRAPTLGLCRDTAGPLRFAVQTS